jgi:type I restriction enzyme R subunit
MYQPGFCLDQIYREYPLRAGRVVVRRHTARRDASTVLRAGFVLFYKTKIPLAVVEAKDSNYAMGAGMAQGSWYEEMLDMPFSFSSNGDGFVFRDATLADGVFSICRPPAATHSWGQARDRGGACEVRQEHVYTEFCNVSFV